MLYKKIPPILFIKHGRGQAQIALFYPHFPRYLYRNFPSAVPRKLRKVQSREGLRSTFSEHKGAASQAPKGLNKGRELYTTQQLVTGEKSKDLTQRQQILRYLLFAAQLGVWNDVTAKRNTGKNKMENFFSFLFTIYASPMVVPPIALQANFVMQSVHHKVVEEQSIAFPSFHDGNQKRLPQKGIPFALQQGPQIRFPSLCDGLKKRRRKPLKDCFESSIYKNGAHLRCKIHLFKCTSIYQNPFFIASHVVLLLQARVSFRQLKHRRIKGIQIEMERGDCPSIKGVRISCSGRVPARSKKAQKARTDSIQWGETSLNVFSELVHFANKSAQTGFGKIGVKVWVCYSSYSSLPKWGITK